MQQITLSDGSIALVSDEDYIYLSGFNWWTNHDYAITKIKGKMIRMHTLIANRMNLKGKIDHKDRNKLNNQRENLREATKQQNSSNSKLYKNNKTGIRGVYWNHINKNYRASIKYKGKTIHIGCYNNIEEAAKAYNEKALELFGEFATLNKGF